MAIRKIVTEGDPGLARKCREVKEINERIITLLDDMKETMELEFGVGLAAPQVGVGRRICIAYPTQDELLELINPELLEKEGEQISVEGCLSVPGYIGDVIRPKRVKIKYLDRTGKEIIREFTDFGAIVVSHEMDHLDGILYIEKATNVREAGDQTEINIEGEK